MARAESITFEEFRTRFSTEDACRAELFRLQFPNGFVCPKCGCTEYYPVRGRNTFQCRACQHQTSVSAGTVMHRTHLPLTVWFWAIYLCATDKRGISAVQLSCTLNICYESAWYLLHRIRRAMTQRDEKYALSGIVEMDDGYIGGATHNGKRGRGTDKAKIVVALSKTENGAALFTRIRLLKMSPAARSSRSLTKLLHRAQKSNATATEAIKIYPALRWTRKNTNPATCSGCTKPSAT